MSALQPVIRRVDWKHDPHAYECYTCDQRGTAPRGNPQCKGCIGRSTHPHWKPHPEYANQAKKAIDAARAAQAASSGGSKP